MKEEVKKEKSIFENKKVYIRFLYKDKSLPKKHPLYGGKHERTGVSLSTPRFEGKPYRDLFTAEELAELSAAMGGEDLSLTSTNPFWSSGITRFTLNKTGLELDLSDPIGVIRYRIATHKIYKDLIGSGKNYSTLCKYAIFSDEQDSDAVKSTNTMFDIAAFYGKHEQNIDILRYVYWKVTGKKIALEAKDSLVQSKVKEIIDLEKAKLARIIKETNLVEKGILLKAVILGKVVKTAVGYKYEGKNLYEGNKGTFDSAAEFLADKTKQNIKFEIQGELE